MAGKPQKPADQLQDRRKGRRRPTLVFLAAQLTPEALARRDAALNVAFGEIGRAFGRGKIPKVSEASATPRERPKRKYRPKAEQTQTPAKAEVAAARPRDARGHFLPLPDSRRARIRAANAALPEALAALVGDGEQLLADLEGR